MGTDRFGRVRMDAQASSEAKTRKKHAQIDNQYMFLNVQQQQQKAKDLHTTRAGKTAQVTYTRTQNTSQTHWHT